jgi:endonuclease/exonuclease/phosphatase family metal-dependent hydrolase
MRLLTYNVHSGIGSDRRYCLERVISVIAEQSPDLVCLQEIDFNLRRSSYQDQPALLARELRAVASLFQLNVHQDQGGYGNLLLSRWPFHSQHNISLHRQWYEPRGAQLVVVATPCGPLHLVNWHLGLAEAERRWQARQLLGHHLFQQSAHLPTLIAGDCNDWLDTLEGSGFHRHRFRQATAPAGRFRSFPSILALVSLDKVYTRGSLDVQQTRIIHSPLARRASDHRPVVLDFLLRQEEPIPTSGTNGKLPAAARRGGLAFWLGWAVSRSAAGVREEVHGFWEEVQRLRRGKTVPAASNNGTTFPPKPHPPSANGAINHTNLGVLIQSPGQLPALDRLGQLPLASGMAGVTPH